MKKAKNNRKHSNPAKLWKRLVLAAQAGNKLAIKILCKAFNPLIMKEAYRIYVLQILGEDAENTAWEIFLDFLQNYKGKNYRQLPGLIQFTLHYSLLHRAYPETKISVDEELVEDAASMLATAATGKNLIADDVCDKDYIDQLLASLTEKQKDIILATIIQDKTLEEYRLQHNISFKVAYARQKTALLKLKQVLENHK